MSSERLSRFVAFATIGTLSTTQQIAGAVLEDIDGADPDLVAEETLCLVATATARSAEVGLQGDSDLAQAATTALFDLPFIYRDYLIGGEMLEKEDHALAKTAASVYERLQRKREFYSVHLPPNQFPGRRALDEKMGLWMGRVSPPRLPEMPTERLQKLGLVSVLLTHLKLVLAFARQE